MEIRNDVIEILTNLNVEWEDSYDFIDLATVGIDSLLFIQILVEVENRFGFEFDDNDLDLSLYKTMDDFLKRIRKYVVVEPG